MYLTLPRSPANSCLSLYFCWTFAGGGGGGGGGGGISEHRHSSCSSWSTYWFASSVWEWPITLANTKVQSIGPLGANLMFEKKNACENHVCKIMAILFQPQCLSFKEYSTTKQIHHCQLGIWCLAVNYIWESIISASDQHVSGSFPVTSDIKGVLYQKQVSRAGTSNYIPQILWDVFTCPCPWCLLLAQH